MGEAYEGQVFGVNAVAVVHVGQQMKGNVVNFLIMIWEGLILEGWELIVWEVLVL